MATIDVHDDEVVVRLTTFEKIFALRGDLRFPRGSVRNVERYDDGLDAVRGFRAPGLALPGIVKVGTWRRRSGKELVVVRRGEPALRIELDGQPFGALVVGGADVDAAHAALG
jgi:hypothetical protein